MNSIMWINLGIISLAIIQIIFDGFFYVKGLYYIRQNKKRMTRVREEFLSFLDQGPSIEEASKKTIESVAKLGSISNEYIERATKKSFPFSTIVFSSLYIVCFTLLALLHTSWWVSFYSLCISVHLFLIGISIRNYIYIKNTNILENESATQGQGEDIPV